MKNPLAWARVLVPVIFSAFCCGAQASSLEIPAVVDDPRRLVTGTDLTTLREIGGMGGTGLSVSPDGRHLAFELHQASLTENDYRAAWFVASTKRETIPIRVDDGGDATLFRFSVPDGRLFGVWIAEYAKWSPDSRGIAYRKRVNGETQIWWSARDGAENEQLTHNVADVEGFLWGRDGSQLYFSTDASRRDLQEQSEYRYRNGHVFDYDKDWSTIDGRPYYPPYSLTGGEEKVWVLDVESRLEHAATADELLEYSRLKQKVSPVAKAPAARQVARTADERAVAWVQPDNPDKQGLFPPMTLYASLAADGSDAVRCPAAECTGVFDLNRPLRNGLHWDDFGDEILFVRREGIGYSKRSLYGWRVGEERVRKIFTTDEWLSDCSIVEDSALCFRETPSYPRTIVSIDLSDESMFALVDPNPEFRSLVVGDVEILEWEYSEDLATFGYLVKPPNYVPGRRYPLVFVGYRAQDVLRGGVGDEYPVHVLAANGFVVLVYEKPTTYDAFEKHTDLLDLAKAMWGPDLFDVRMPLAAFDSAIRVLADRGLIDPTRVAVTGVSNGVNHVNYSLIHSNLFAAAITSSSDNGTSNRALIGASGRHRDYLRVIGMGGAYPGPHAFLYSHMSLALNAQRVNAPLLINVSDSESPQALEEVIALIEHGKPVDLIVYPDEGHVKWQPAHRLSVYERNVDWMNFWLQGKEDSTPEKAPQYKRWRKLRELHRENTESAGKEYVLPRPNNAATQR